VTERATLAARLETAAHDLLVAAAALRQPTTIACGDTYPDRAVEASVREARERTGAPVDAPTCGGRELVWTEGFRCAECGRWFHRTCLLAHFAFHKD
jgi:hypothetical protein